VHLARRRKRFAWGTALLVACVGCLSAGQQLDIKNLIKSGNLEGVRWPDFSDYRNWLQKFYESSGFARVWGSELAGMR